MAKEIIRPTRLLKYGAPAIASLAIMMGSACSEESAPSVSNPESSQGEQNPVPTLEIATDDASIIATKVIPTVELTAVTADSVVGNPENSSPTIIPRDERSLDFSGFNYHKYQITDREETLGDFIEFSNLGGKTHLVIFSRLKSDFPYSFDTVAQFVKDNIEEKYDLQKQSVHIVMIPGPGQRYISESDLRENINYGQNLAYKGYLAEISRINGGLEPPHWGTMPAVYIVDKNGKVSSYFLLSGNESQVLPIFNQVASE